MLVYTYAFVNTKNVLIAMVRSIQLTPEQITTLETMFAGTMKYTWTPEQYHTSADFVVGMKQLGVDNIWRPYIRTLTRYGFNSRFTTSELVTIQTMSRTDDLIAVLQNKFNIAESIDLDEPSVLEGMQYLMAVGVLTQARVDEILA